MKIDTDKIGVWASRNLKGAPHSAVSVTQTEHFQLDFRFGEPAPSYDNEVTVRGIIEKDGNLYFCSHTPKGIDHIGLALLTSKHNWIKTNVIIPINKSPRPEQFHEVKFEDIELGMPNELIKDLAESSKLKEYRKSTPKTTALLELRNEYLLDKREGEDDIIVEYDTINFFVNLDLFMNDRNKISRTVGISPMKLEEIGEIYDMIPYITDITPDKKLGDADQTFSGVSDYLLSIAKMTYEHEFVKNLKPGNYPTIVPMDVLPHECICHLFEDEIENYRTDIYDEPISYPPFFEGGERIGPETLTILDNPKAELKGHLLCGSRKVDNEGFGTAPKRLVHKGITTGNLLGSRYSPNTGGVGNGIAYSDVLPIPRQTITDTYFYHNGPNSVAELVESNSKPVIVCNRSSGYVNRETGNFVIGSGASRYDYSIETYLLKDGILAPIRMPHILVGSAGLCMKGAVIGGRDTVSYRPAICTAPNPTSAKAIDHIYTSQVGPLACVEGLYLRPLKDTGIRRHF